MAWNRRDRASRIGLFVQQYARPRGRQGHDPNDRRYDRDVERRIRHLPATELDRLMRDEDDD